ncbi:hypothetical protein [Clostridium sp.]|uniref:hypothetical protein n=1 Tax=Clostridium sp. TaxID=1506 RepID=UPI0028443DB8|nr:hypothetical protein [Clostridium sp.]MDR3593594.1 hypothetical protein [Clostridium sp.]
MSEKAQVYTITNEYIKSNYIKTLSYELIETIIYFLCAYPILLIINHYMKNQDGLKVYSNSIIIVPIIFMTYLRVKIKKVIYSILAILGVMIISAFIMSTFLKEYVNLVFLVIWGIICIKKSISTQRFEFNLQVLIFIEALLIPQIICACYLDLNSIEFQICIIAIVVMLISLGYICKARNIRLSMEDSENQNFKKRDSNIFIGGLIIFIVIIILMIYKLGVFDEASSLTKKIASFFGDLGKDNISKPKENVSNYFAKDNPSNIFQNLNKAPSELVQTITKIIDFILNMGSIAIILSASYVVINRILIYIKNLKNIDKVTFVYNGDKKTEIKEKVKRFRYNMKKSILLDERENVRRLYKNKILKYTSRNIVINNHLSTNEIQNEILTKTNENITKITAVYEKARYSNEDITKQDLDILKMKRKNK